MNKAAYSILDAAQLYGVSSDIIRQAIHATSNKGGIPPLPAKKIGPRYLIAADALAEWFSALPDA